MHTGLTARKSSTTRDLPLPESNPPATASTFSLKVDAFAAVGQVPARALEKDESRDFWKVLS